jgi:hypothetical protein
MPLDLFVDDTTEEIEVTIFIGASKSRKFMYADIDEAKVKEVAGDDLLENSIEKHSVFFRTPSFGDAGKILDSAVTLNKDNNIQISPSELRFERIATLILRWTLKAGGNDIKPNRENIKKLHPVVATVIGLDLEYQLQQRGLL